MEELLGETHQTIFHQYRLGGSNGLPYRLFTHLEVDPYNPNEILLTASGYGSGHIFRTTDGAATYWQDITGNLTSMDNSANYIIIHYTGCDTKEYIVACDLRVFRTDANNISWTPLALGLPNTVVTGLDYNRFSGLLRASTYGRGIWEVPLTDASGNPVPDYIKDNIIINTNSLNINHNINICPGGALTFPTSCVVAVGREIKYLFKMVAR